MQNLFKKAAVFTDIHFGLKNNSSIHNQDCEDYIDWFIDIPNTGKHAPYMYESEIEKVSA